MEVREKTMQQNEGEFAIRMDGANSSPEQTWSEHKK